MTSFTQASRPFPLREAHAHLAMHGRALTMVHAGECRDSDAFLALVVAESHRLRREDPSGSRWLLVHGARVESWDDATWPSRARFDEAAGGRPAAAFSFDQHAVLANTRAFRAAGFDDGDADPEGGVIVRDGTGAPTGVLLESACWRIRATIPELAGQDRTDALLTAIADLASHGFVEVHDLLAPPWLGPELARLHDEGRLSMRVGLFAPLAEVESQFEASRTWSRPGLTLLGGKVFADGTLNSRTAWMLTPFRNPMPGHERGTPLMSVDSLTLAMERCGGLGLGLAVHAIGDGAVRATLDARARASARRALRIEHAEIVHPDDIGRFKALGVTASLQPCHLLADIEVLRRELPDRLGDVLPIRSLIASGLTPGHDLLFGSDVPIVRADPGDSVQAAVWRRRPEMPVHEGVSPGHAISEEESWRCFRAE